MGTRDLWRRWLVLVTAGEFVGFVVPALVGIWAIDRTAVSQFALMPVAGAAEGALLGASQALVLRDTLAAAYGFVLGRGRIFGATRAARRRTMPGHDLGR